MTVTEIALLHLSQDVTVGDADVCSKLAHARTVMQRYTGRTFYFLQQIEDPAYIYIIGEWDSVDQHMHGFIPSGDNQALLESLKDLLIVEWMLHIDAPHTNLPLPGPATSNTKAPIYGIDRHLMKVGHKEQFKRTYDNEERHLQAFVTEGKIGGGWRIDSEGGKDEWVMLTPWMSVEQHHAFAETAGSVEYGKIREHVVSAEIKHARVLVF